MRLTTRPCVRGKFIFSGTEKLFIRGVTYGTFRPRENDEEYPEPEVVERDFALMAANGLNAVRTYTVPPRWLLDAAQRHGLSIMVGLPLERYIGFLTDRQGAPDIDELVRTGVRACAGHPAVLCYTIGNEIPASMVRWYGHRRVERFLERLYRVAKVADPGGLVTYVNYPSTEYLQLPFLDFLCFNVYLEQQDRLEAYLARLQNQAGDRPLIMSEIGLDSRRNGEDVQAQTLAWQVRTAFEAGCAGAFVYAWTDEWYRGGAEVDDWDFGLTRRDRSPKPALAAVRAVISDLPLSSDLPWPRISVILCSHNGARTIRGCLEGLRKLEYPDYEVIVVDDGSSDNTAAIANEFDFRLISTGPCGLSSARNTGLAAATGEIVAYIDDDAYPDPHWLTYLAATFLSTSHAGVGGPNISPPGGGAVADCVANAAGNPVHVLLSDREAEHIPGCNMAFWKVCLESIGGFDPRFLTAGDDVDVCWRLQQRGWTLGFSPAAMVWHHRRNSIRTYWKQQYGYGKAEALLEAKWPEKYNAAGHPTWAGRMYGQGLAPILGRMGRIYHGIWGSAPFQSIYQPASNMLGALPLMPEWYLVCAALALLVAMGFLWLPLLILAVPLLAAAVSASLIQAGLGASRASFTREDRSHVARLKLRVLTAGLYLLQPLARLCGRLAHGLSPWRWRGVTDLAFPRPRTLRMWSERWQASEARLQALEVALQEMGMVVQRGGNYDRWDLIVRGGMLSVLRILMAVEEHGEGRQLIRFRAWPGYSRTGLVLVLICATLTLSAILDQAGLASALLSVMTLVVVWRMVKEWAAAMAAVLHLLQEGTAAIPVLSSLEQLGAGEN